MRMRESAISFDADRARLMLEPAIAEGDRQRTSIKYSTVAMTSPTRARISGIVRGPRGE